MFQITIDYNRAHIMHSEPIRTVALQDEANEFARHLASNMIYALTTDSFYDGFSDADPFTATLTDYEKSVLYSVFLAKPDDFWFHVINDQTGELVNAADDEYPNEPTEPCHIETDDPDDQPFQPRNEITEFICELPNRHDLVSKLAVWCYEQNITCTQEYYRVHVWTENESERQAVMGWMNEHRNDPLPRKFRFHFGEGGAEYNRMLAFSDYLDSRDLKYCVHHHNMYVTVTSDEEIQSIINFLN